MADKKPAPKPASSSSEGQLIFVALIGVIIVLVILPTLATFFGVDTSGISADSVASEAKDVFGTFVEILSFIAIFVAFVITLLIIYAKTQYSEVTKAYSEATKAREGMLYGGVKQVPVAEPVDFGVVTQTPYTVVPSEPDPRWAEIVRHMDSHTQSDWRMAVLEADILLGDMLTQMGYQGASIGEMLKQVDKTNFVTLDDAWKAHRIRNIIAHEGSSYELAREEAERVIRLYERVFTEFYFI